MGKLLKCESAVGCEFYNIRTDFFFVCSGLSCQINSGCTRPGIPEKFHENGVHHRPVLVFQNRVISGFINKHGA